MSHDPSGLIVIVPAFNEELTISMVVTLSKRFAEKVIVVDDGSPDRTSELALEAGAEVIRQDPNQGKAAALRVGMKRARELSPRCVIMMDGDGQMDPAHIPIVAAPVIRAEADLVIGSRFIGQSNGIPRYRVLGQKVLNRATNIGGKVKISDSQSGFRALSKKALDNMDFGSDSYNVESDMIAHFAQRGLRIVEVPISVRYDVPNGHKQHPVKHGLSVFNRMISYIGFKRPMLLFGVPGIIIFVLGTFLCFATFVQFQVIFQWTLITQGIAGVSFFGVGLFLMFAALILNSLGMLMQTMTNNMRKGDY